MCSLETTYRNKLINLHSATDEVFEIPSYCMRLGGVLFFPEVFILANAFII